MNGLKISFAVVAFVLVQGIGVIWYVSKLDSRVDQMYKSFEEENKKEVIENQVKMKLDLENFIVDMELRKGNPVFYVETYCLEMGVFQEQLDKYNDEKQKGIGLGAQGATHEI